MREKNSNVTPLRPRETPSSGPHPPSLEERLEDARARRAKALAQKSSKSGLKTSRPWLLEGQPDDEDFDPAAEIAAFDVDPPLPPEPGPDPIPLRQPDVTIVDPTPAPLIGPRRRSLLMQVIRGASAGALLVAFGAISTLILFPTPDRGAPDLTAPPADADITLAAPLDWEPTILVPGTQDAAPDTVAVPALPEAETTAAPSPGVELPLSHNLVVTAQAAEAMSAVGDARVRMFATETADREATAGVERVLAGFGLDIGATTPVAFEITRNEIRYYARSERRAAEAIGILLGAPAVKYPARAGTRGFVDVWIAGELGS